MPLVKQYGGYVRLSSSGTGVKVVRNSLYLISSQIACRALGMVIAIWLARYLGDAAFGRYTFIIIVVGFATIATNFGLDQVMIRAVAQEHEKSAVFMGSGFIVRLAVFLIGIAPLVFFISVINKPYDLKIGLLIGYLAVIFISLSGTFNNVFYGHERLGIPATLQLTAKIFQVGLIFFAINLHLSLVWIVSTLAFSELFRAWLLWFFSAKQWGKPQISRTMIADLSRQSLPFLGIALLSMVQSRSDVIFLSFLCSDEAVGWYGAAINLTFGFLIISSSVSNALFPVFSRLTDISQRSRLIAVYHRSLTLLLLIGMPIALSITILAPKIINLIYPDSFKPASLVLAITIWSVPVIFVSSAIIRIINAFHYERFLLFVVTMCAIASVGINMVLIPQFAQVGAAITNLIIAVLAMALCIIVAERKIAHMKYPLSAIFRSAPGLFCLAILLWWLRNAPWVFLIPVCIITYIILIILFRALPMDDIRIILRMFRHSSIQKNQFVSPVEE